MAAITSAEIVFKRSIKTGTAGNSLAQADPNASLGKYVSTTAWAGGTANDLFDDITGTENAAGHVDYRCIFVHNTNTANILQNAVVYVSADTGGGATIAVASDSIAASAPGATAAQAAEIATETTAPTGIGAWSSESNVSTGIAAGVSLGNIGVNEVKAFWIRRTLTANTAALSNDGVTIAVTGDTGSL